MIGGGGASGTESGLKRTAAEAQSGGGEADADGEGGGEDEQAKKKKRRGKPHARTNERREAREEAPAGASELR